jgi:hypothetical protein
VLINQRESLSVPDVLQQKLAIIQALAFFVPLASKVDKEQLGFIF